MRILKPLWIPLLILVVLVAGAFTVSRLHGVFGSAHRPSYADTEAQQRQPYDPKHLTYEVFGPPGAVANISYFDQDAEPRYIAAATLPWSLSFPMADATAVANIVAQGDADSIGCRITVDHEVKTERLKQGASAFTFCRLTAA
jgi:hypothetical protein